MTTPLKINLSAILEKIQIGLQILKRYRFLISVVLVLLLYGFVVWRIGTLNSAQPSSDAISAATNPIATAHVDKSVVSQLQRLQDNSVSVQTLFEQARNNPFNE